MRAWLRDLFVRVFCTHPILLGPETAHHKMNWDNIYKVKCVTCKRELRRKGHEMARYKERECLCVMVKK